jgi:hypothetical protein
VRSRLEAGAPLGCPPLPGEGADLEAIRFAAPALSRKSAHQKGKRYSFGYPGCPRLEDQALLFQVLRPEEIGVQLTDGCMMEPEASVSALVFHHPRASYFAVT